MVSVLLPVSLSLVCTALLLGSGLDRPLHVSVEQPATPVPHVLQPAPTCAVPRPAEVSRAQLPQHPPILQLAAQAIDIADRKAAAAETPTLSSDELLTAWQQAAGELLAPNAEVRKRMLHQYRETLNGHQLSLLIELSGPIDSEALAARYRWSVVSEQPHSLELIAEPRDEIERLFWRHCTVTFQRGSKLPQSVVFATRDGLSATVALQTLRRPAGESFAPLPLLQTAERTAERLQPVPTNTNSLFGSNEPGQTELAALPEDLRQTLQRWEAASFRRGPFELQVRQRQRDVDAGRQLLSYGALRFHSRLDYQLRMTDSTGVTTVVTADSLASFAPQNPVQIAPAADDETTLEVAPGGASDIVAISAEAVDAPQPPTELQPLHLALPFVLELNAAELARNFTWSKRHVDARQVVLRGVPKSAAAVQQFRQVEVTLDRTTYRPLMIRCTSPGGVERTQTLLERALDHP